MADSHAPEGHGGATVNVYLIVFAALCVFTAVSFIVNLAEPTIGLAIGVAIILAVAVCKAVLVAMFFMHLLFDWAKLYFMIFPVLILGMMMVIVLLPDIVLAWHHH